MVHSWGVQHRERPGAKRRTDAALSIVFTHGVARNRGALQPATPPTMRSQAAGAFDSTFANKRNFAIIIIVMQPVCLCRRTPFIISSSYVHEENLWLSMQPVCLCRLTLMSRY